MVLALAGGRRRKKIPWHHSTLRFSAGYPHCISRNSRDPACLRQEGENGKVLKLYMRGGKIDMGLFQYSGHFGGMP